MRMRGAVTMVALGLALTGGTADAQGKPTSSTKQFKYKSGKIDPGMLYTYVRSDLAGTKTGSVLVYIPDRKRVEILRVSPGVEGGQLLTGEMNWDTYTLRQFELWSEGKDGGKKRLATGTLLGRVDVHDGRGPALYRGAPGATTFSRPARAATGAHLQPRLHHARARPPAPRRPESDRPRSASSPRT